MAEKSELRAQRLEVKIYIFFNLWTTNSEIFTRNNNSIYELGGKVSSQKLSM